MESLMTLALLVGVVLIALLVIGTTMARLYKRASKEIAFVRTGLGGQRVVLDGGALVLPVVHDTIPVNMNTLRLEVQRINEQALITHDRMRADVQAEFYVRVQPTQEAIANAAQTLGQRTMQPRDLRELVEGKFVDALRAVAAEMAMEELHEKRVDFVQKVQMAVTEDLLKNGLELESVSLTSLDQTSRDFLNPQNAFDAQGLTLLTQQIEMRRKERNDIEQETEVAVQSKNLEAERQKLEIAKQQEHATLEQQRDVEYARLAQTQEIEIRRAAQVAEIARQKAEREREAKETEIAAQQKVDQVQIQSEKIVEEERIKKEQLIRESEIARARALETAEIEKTKTVELSEQERAITIAHKSKEQSEAQAEADRARAEAVQAAEAVITAQEREQADREKQVELVQAAKEAEQLAIGITVAAEAEKQAAEDRAAALRTLAQGEADKARIEAEGDAQAELAAAEAAEKRYAVDAAGKLAINEASNILSADQIAMQIKMLLIEHLPGIIRESVKPIEQIEGIKIWQVDGLGGTAHGPSEVNGTGGTNLAEQMVNSALRYRSQAPLLDSLLNELGLSGGHIQGLTASLYDASPGTRPTTAGVESLAEKTSHNHDSEDGDQPA